MFSILSALFVGAITGFVSERLNLTRFGYVLAIAIGVGGAMVFWFAQYMLGIGFGFGRGLTALIGAAGMLFLANLRR